MKNFKKLKVWQQEFQIAINTYKLTKDFPSAEKSGLTSQVNKASISISSNIAEGSSRKSEQDYYRFLEFALGSCFELESQLLIASELKFDEKGKIDNLLQQIDEEQKMLMSFMNKLNI